MVVAIEGGRKKENYGVFFRFPPLPFYPLPTHPTQVGGVGVG